jgi:antitoxin component of MazEF toxin-antitoxin module
MSKKQTRTKKTLVRHGNSLALIIDKPMLDLLKIDATTPLEISAAGRELVVRPCNEGAEGPDLNTALEWVNSAYAPALKRLAD